MHSTALHFSIQEKKKTSIEKNAYLEEIFFFFHGKNRKNFFGISFFFRFFCLLPLFFFKKNDGRGYCAIVNSKRERADVSLKLFRKSKKYFKKKPQIEQFDEVTEYTKKFWYYSCHWHNFETKKNFFFFCAFVACFFRMCLFIQRSRFEFEQSKWEFFSFLFLFF